MTTTLFTSITLVVVLALRLTSAASLAIASPDPSPNSTKFSVRLQKGLLSVETEEGAWEKFLQELRRKCGIVFHLINISLEGTVTASFKDLPLERAIQQLFGRDVNFMFVYRNRQPPLLTSGLPSEVWVFGRGTGQISKTFRRADTQDSVPPDLEDANDPAQAIVREFERNPQAARDAARRHPDPTVRLMAIAYLGEHANEQSIKILLDLLQDHDAHMRQSALEALGPSVENNPQVRKVMAHVMETTEDPEIRQLVADSLGVELEKDKIDRDSHK
jgi:hypothetical protein